METGTPTRHNDAISSARWESEGGACKAPAEEERDARVNAESRQRPSATSRKGVNMPNDCRPRRSRCSASDSEILFHLRHVDQLRRRVPRRARVAHALRRRRVVPTARVVNMRAQDHRPFGLSRWDAAEFPPQGVGNPGTPAARPAPKGEPRVGPQWDGLCITYIGRDGVLGERETPRSIVRRSRHRRRPCCTPSP